jgi:hypothetical protein
MTLKATRAVGIGIVIVVLCSLMTTGIGVVHHEADCSPSVLDLSMEAVNTPKDFTDALRYPQISYQEGGSW